MRRTVGFRYGKNRKSVSAPAAAAKGTFARTLQDMRQSEVNELIARLAKPKRNLGGADDA